MANIVTALVHALTKKRNSFLSSLERYTKFLSPSDWLVVAVLGALLFGSSFALFAHVSRETTIEVPARGGMFSEGLIGNPRFINPLLALSDTDRDLSILIYSGLMKSEANGTVTPDIAESYTLSEDGLTYTFTIKEDALFHDGTPVTADDVVFTIERAQSPEIKSPRRANWEGVIATAVDSRTVSFSLKSPYAPFLENTTLGILPSHLWNNVSNEEFAFSTLNAEPVGSGPYRLESVKRNASGIPVEYRLKAFTRGVRVPFITNLIFRFYPNADELSLALNQGEVQAAHSIDPSAITNAAPREAVFGRIFALFFNQNQNEIFLEEAVREALDRAIDKERIVSTVLGGYGSVIDGPLPPRSALSTEEAREEREARRDSARTILENAGWKLGEDGIYQKTVKKETKRLAFSLATTNAPELKGTAEMIAEDLASVGASVELKFFEQTDLNTDVLRPRKYDALLFGLVVGHDFDLFAFWHSSQRNDPGLNIALYASINADKQLEAARVEHDEAARIALTEEAAKTITDEYAAVFLYAPHFVYVIPKNIGGVELGTIATPDDRFSSIEDWHVQKTRVWPVFSTLKNYFSL